MIPQTVDTWQVFNWKDELRDAVTDVYQLLQMLELDSSDLSSKIIATSEFPLRVPMSFIRRMAKGDPQDPLLLQVLPLTDENLLPDGFSQDPLKEKDYNPAPGIVHKYHGRVLLITTPVCAVNCRYCFRRHFPYSDNNPGKKSWIDSLAYIAGDSSISEVILSGGDPLASTDQHLAWLVGEIEKIPHVQRLRIHSRLPVVIPSRIDQQLTNWLRNSRLQTTMVLHVNHPHEINADLAEAVGKLRAINIQVLNQAVLLHGVNDNSSVLIALSERLFSIGVMPYYLHLLDPVAGASHFDVAEVRAIDLYRDMRERLPGYLLPRLVKDVPGESSKMQIAPQK